MVSSIVFCQHMCYYVFTIIKGVSKMTIDFNLKAFREERLKMTQAELAQLLNVRQDFISRLEKNPTEISLELLVTLASKTGQTLDQLVNYKPAIPEALVPENHWVEVEHLMRHVHRSIDDVNLPQDDCYGLATRLTELKYMADNLSHKPRIAFLGRSDSGKSTLINSILGTNKMPTSWSPTTSIVVYIKHIQDRPSFISEDCWVFKKGQDGSEWDETKLSDEEYCNTWKVSSGDASILSSYGTRTGNQYSEEKIGSAVVFIDSPILTNCDFLDVPGFTGGQESDNKAAQEAKSKADAIVFLSQANSFLGIEDVEYLKQALNVLPIIEKIDCNNFSPLGNLFVVASQSHIVNNGNRKELEKILNNGAERLFTVIADDVWKEKQEISGYSYTEHVLRDRFFTYTTDIKNLRKLFENSFKKTTEDLAILTSLHLKTALSNYCAEKKEDLKNVICTIENQRNNKEILEKEYIDLLKAEPQREVDTLKFRNKILMNIKNSQDESCRIFEKKYNSILNEDYILNVIEKKGFKNKKEDIQMLASYINSKVNSKFNKVLKKQSEKICEDINQYLEDFDNSCKSTLNNSFSYDFNTKAAFASGLTGLAALGGLSFWAASLGNLGAYILVAKGVSVLAALGISVGGTAAAVSAVAAIGGPIVLGIAAALIIALSVFGLISIGWQKRVAKKIIQSYREQNVLQKYNNAIYTFWEDTINAVNKGLDELDKRWKLSLEIRKKQLQETDDQALKNSLRVANNIKEMFSYLLNLITPSN